MNEFLDKIAATLKSSREAKGLSQRALAQRAGLPQSHISKIESGGVDLRTSSLVELGRALDLEMMLVPRKAVPAVKSIVRNISGSDKSLEASTPLSNEAKSTAREITRFRKNIDAALTKHPGIKELAQLQRQSRELEQLRSAFVIPAAFRELREATKAIQSFQQEYESTNPNAAIEQLRQTARELSSLRNYAVHNIPKIERPKPAYSLEEEDDG